MQRHSSPAKIFGVMFMAMILAVLSMLVRPNNAAVLVNTKFTTVPFFILNPCTGPIAGTLDAHVVVRTEGADKLGFHQNFEGTGTNLITGATLLVRNEIVRPFSRKGLEGVACGELS